MVVVGFSGTLVLGSGSGIMGRSSSLGIVGAKITSNTIVTKEFSAYILISPNIPQNKQILKYTPLPAYLYFMQMLCCFHCLGF
jgi:hypothetical protein